MRVLCQKEMEPEELREIKADLAIITETKKET